MKPVKRCALYTRKSSDEGLDQAFNSLDAQREACQAYVKSQKGEGWRALATIYDDGGYSGGTMERPALQRLLADIEADRVDVVVVYKIDRLTRSLTDFARMVDLFDRHGVTFVSVTQAFNTTTSMGRLTLNVLLSFAQFEREVTGERIRDKIAASKSKGMWMGGNVPLGYDLPTEGSRALVVNEAEAAAVRTIFSTYLELGSVHALQRWLDARGIRSKRRRTCAGRTIGGRAFSRGALFQLLRNRIYLGQIVHKDKVHDGLHPAIVDVALFEAVQAKLDANVRRHAECTNRVTRAPLTGRIFDGDGQPMSPSFTHGKRGQVYRYYVSAPLLRGRRPAGDSGIRRVPGPALEAIVSSAIKRLVPPGNAEPLLLPTRIEIHAASLQVLMPVALLATMRARLEAGETAAPDAAEPNLLRLELPIRMRLRGGRTWIIGAAKLTSRRDPVLIRGLRAAHAMLGTDPTGHPTLDAAPASSYRRRLVRLAFLAPDLQRAILAGQQPPGLTLESLLYTPMPILWSDQAAMVEALGVTGPTVRRDPRHRSAIACYDVNQPVTAK
jgi:DNA invertase Pin-like site-specific DNA recombinase